MRTDDELLAHVRSEAGRRIRRRRAAAGTVAAVVLLVGGAAVATSRPGGDQVQVRVEEGTTTTTDPTTTTSESTTTSTSTPSTTTTSTTSTPASTTTSTTEPATPPGDTASITDDGLTLTLTAVQDPARPLEVVLTLRAQAEHGSHAGGGFTWGDGTGEQYGSGLGITDCIPEEGDPPPGPDPYAGPIDETLTFTHTYAAPGPVTVYADLGISLCTTDGNGVGLELSFEVRG